MSERTSQQVWWSGSEDDESIALNNEKKEEEVHDSAGSREWLDELIGLVIEEVEGKLSALVSATDPTNSTICTNSSDGCKHINMLKSCFPPLETELPFTSFITKWTRLKALWMKWKSCDATIPKKSRT
jgi:hypothetical protein